MVHALGGVETTRRPIKKKCINGCKDDEICERCSEVAQAISKNKILGEHGIPLDAYLVKAFFPEQHKDNSSGQTVKHFFTFASSLGGAVDNVKVLLDNTEILEIEYRAKKVFPVENTGKDHVYAL